MELGKVEIFFGKVVSVADEDKICRCQVVINGLTEEIATEDLPWYFPWYGRMNLPVVNDTVPVIIFDDNIVTGFYGNKIDLVDANVSDDDYENYLEIFKRNIDDNNVQLTYVPSTGIEFINGETKQQIELDKLSLFCKTNSIVMTENRIDLGDDNNEASLMGDMTVKELQDIIKHQANTINSIYNIVSAIIAGCVTPFTAPIAVQLTPQLATKATLVAENKKVEAATNKLQSKTVYNAK